MSIIPLKGVARNIIFRKYAILHVLSGKNMPKKRSFTFHIHLTTLFILRNNLPPNRDVKWKAITIQYRQRIIGNDKITYTFLTPIIVDDYLICDVSRVTCSPRSSRFQEAKVTKVKAKEVVTSTPFTFYNRFEFFAKLLSFETRNVPRQIGTNIFQWLNLNLNKK